MKISAQLELIRDGVSGWAKENKGSAEIALDVNHLFALLSIAPGGFRVAVKFVGESKRGENEEAGMVDRKFQVAFSFGQSMKLNKGDALTDGSGGGRPMADLVEELRDQLRALQFDPDDTEVTPDYKGAFELTNISPEILIDGFYLEIWIGSLLPQPGTTA